MSTWPRVDSERESARNRAQLRGMSRDMKYDPLAMCLRWHGKRYPVAAPKPSPSGASGSRCFVTLTQPTPVSEHLRELPAAFGRGENRVELPVYSARMAERLVTGVEGKQGLKSKDVWFEGEEPLRTPGPHGNVIKRKWWRRGGSNSPQNAELSWL